MRLIPLSVVVTDDTIQLIDSGVTRCFSSSKDLPLILLRLRWSVVSLHRPLHCHFFCVRRGNESIHLRFQARNLFIGEIQVIFQDKHFAEEDVDLTLMLSSRHVLHSAWPGDYLIRRWCFRVWGGRLGVKGVKSESSLPFESCKVFVVKLTGYSHSLIFFWVWKWSKLMFFTRTRHLVPSLYSLMLQYFIFAPARAWEWPFSYSFLLLLGNLHSILL